MNNRDAAPRNNSWFALADAERCRLFHCSITGCGALHVEEHDAIDNQAPEQEHARPMSGSGTTHHVEERERRFASQIVEWLRNKTKETGPDRLALLAPARMLGLLRKTPQGSMNGHLEELQGDLMRLDAAQLGKHSMILDLVRNANTREVDGLGTARELDRRD